MWRSSSFVLSASLVMAACGAEPVGVGDGSLGDTEDGIVGGAAYTGLPAVGSITVDGQEYCTGTLIGPRKVITAAHCLEDPTASQMRFVIGAKISRPDYTLAVSSFKQHPSYNSSTITNDVGLVTLASDAPIAALDVNRQMDTSWQGTQLFFVGYGVTSAASNSGAGTKRAVSMTISTVNAKTFEYDDPGKNTCYGDSGGPAFFRDASGNYLVAGVTSYGDQDCTQYGVDTRVDKFLDFVGATGGTQPTPTPTPTPAPSGGTVVVKGVSFTSAQAAAVLSLANTASQSVLDNDVGLDSRAAANIVAARPFSTLQQLAAVPYVGTSALKKLKAYAAAG